MRQDVSRLSGGEGVLMNLHQARAWKLHTQHNRIHYGCICVYACVPTAGGLRYFDLNIGGRRRVEGRARACRFVCYAHTRVPEGWKINTTPAAVTQRWWYIMAIKTQRARQGTVVVISLYINSTRTISKRMSVRNTVAI